MVKTKRLQSNRTGRFRWKRLNKRLGELMGATCFLGPSFLGVLLFFIIPFGVVVWYSVIQGPVNHEFVGLQHYKAVLGNDAFKLAIKNTAVFMGISVPASVVLSMVLALILECRIPMKTTFRTFFLSPMVVPIASIILVWQVLFHHNGVVNEFLLTFDVEKLDWLKSDWCMVPVILLYLWKNLGYFMILFMAALNNIPKTLLEVADVEGASAWYKFLHIKLRYLSPTVLFVTILSMINAFKVFREVYLLTGGYPYSGLYMLQHFMNNMFGKNLDYQRLSAAAVLLALVMIVLIALLFWAEDRFGKDVEG